jgi:hypothetical protein
MRGIGTRLFRSVDGTIDSYVQLTGIMNLTVPEMTRGATDITPLDTQDNTKKYEAGIADVGEAEFDLIYDQASSVQATLTADYDSGDTVFYKILYPDSSIQLFPGFTTKLGREIPKEESILRKLGLKAAGKVLEFATDTTVT